MAVHLVLLRAIGPATHAKMSMQDLREACRAEGLDAVATYIQTGNLIIGSDLAADAVRTAVERALSRFGLTNRVVVRRPEALAAILDENPFPEAAANRPSDLSVCFLAQPVAAERLAQLEGHAGPERVRLAGEDLCVDYPDGVTGSKLLPGVIERRLGVPLTFRNWNTVAKLVALAREA
jgi:uncharacterized protein (DUF1697 family)